jgi:hypothetical protein
LTPEAFKLCLMQRNIAVSSYLHSHLIVITTLHFFLSLGAVLIVKLQIHILNILTTLEASAHQSLPTMSALAYSTITNGVDHRLVIIMHNQSRYYNITKTATLFQTLKQEQVDGNSHQPSKRGKLIPDWFRNRVTREKIQECANLNSISIEDCSFIINEGVDNAFRGTYIHPDLYDHFVMLLSPKYSMCVSAILKQHHYAANMKVLKEKDIRLIH